MAEFLGSEDVLQIHSTDAATPREENRNAFGPIWEKKHENSSCYHDSYHDSWYMLVKPIQD